jgi:hypothetical protein
MERKFISRLFINQAKESGKTYLKGTITIKQADIAGFLNGDGDLVVPVFGHTHVGETKTGQQYKAFNLEVVQDEDNNKKSTTTSQKTYTKSNKPNIVDSGLPF